MYIQSYPKLGFNLLNDIFSTQTDLVKFCEDKIIKKLDIFKTHEKYANNFNFYNQYFSYKIIIATCMIDYFIYLFNSRQDKASPFNTQQKYCLKFLEQANRELPAYVVNNKHFEIEKCILATINLIYSCFTFLEITDYELTQSEGEVVSKLMTN